ncbi:hypothetical protein HELRODRAFT_90898 [Helobdella robusta]|uniref:Large ribosomal subunit protein bL17m n=1 Tax=Helobdella robusta TaxID=6412 RepID=T1G7X7_HELRO|nr:hypothetical protein HELRODRAFT_90898 [Helobdella robusta]ESN90216.1 hypothetical protein HELRODRAFT_90898 [Helobdella robusta]
MLRIVYRNAQRNMPTAEGIGSGPQGRINKLRRLVTNLLRFERIEDKAFYLDESRGYAELIVQEALKHGDKHKPTMDMLDYWILEKDLIYKLFNELIPRYKSYDKSITKIYQLPTVFPGKGVKLGVLELKGEIFNFLFCNKIAYRC